jgi:hypothetical protein
MSSDARARTDTRECNRLFAFGMGKQYGGSRTVSFRFLEPRPVGLAVGELFFVSR